MKRAGVSSRFGLPLLSKELIEQAARKRTYILRVVYAALLFVAASLLFYDTLRIGSASPFAALGHGREVFAVVMGLQFAGVYLFMPAITCGVLTQEKERDSLMLLFLTRLGPWTIILEKFVGRLIPMLCFLLLSLPLLAFAYTLGGVTATTLWTGVWMLMLATIQAGSIALMCSSWFRTTVGAFIASYVIGVGLFIGPPVLISLLLWDQYPGNMPFFQAILSLGIYDQVDQIMAPFFVPVQFFAGQIMNGAPGIMALFLRSVPILLQSLVCLVLARVFVVRRAFVPARNPILAFFKSLDRVFKRLNENRLTRGVVIAGDRTSLPASEPVAWRETTKRSLGRPNYLFRIFLAIEVPLCFVLLLIAMFEQDGGLEGVSLMLFLLWVLAALIIAVQSASLIAGERSHQTLDVLAVTPLTGRQILLQKFRGVRRVILVLMIPFATMFLFGAWWRDSLRGGHWMYHREFSVTLYLVASALSVVIYLPLVAWASTLIGLLVRSQPRAIITAVGTIVGWCILPLVFIVLPMFIIISPGGPNHPMVFLTLLSPATIIPMNEFNDLQQYAHVPWLAVILNFMGYGTALLIVRLVCLINADRFLGRVETR